MKYNDRDDAKESQKRNYRVREVLGTVLLVAVLVKRIVFHEADSDIVFDAGGKAVVIILILIFIMISYIQSNKIDQDDKL
jgi:hypothetical protein